eukprot:6132001-Pleurochrysis_carterae.AAC.2
MSGEDCSQRASIFRCRSGPFFAILLDATPAQACFLSFAEAASVLEDYDLDPAPGHSRSLNDICRETCAWLNANECAPWAARKVISIRTYAYAVFGSAITVYERYLSGALYSPPPPAPLSPPSPPVTVLEPVDVGPDESQSSDAKDDSEQLVKLPENIDLGEDGRELLVGENVQS